MAKTIVAVIGDLHAGGTTAIATPQYTIHTGRKNETVLQPANNAQAWIFACWLDFWDYIKTLAVIRGRSRQHRLITVFLGEFCDSHHHGGIQHIGEQQDHIALAKAIMQPAVDMSDGGFYVTPGTEAHSGPAGQIDYEIADSLGARLVDWQLTLDVDGVLMDFAHHGRSGQRDWTSSAAGIGAAVMLEYAKCGMPLPRYIFRGHSHVIDDSGEKIECTRTVCTPSWQLRTAYGYKVSSSKRRSDIGGLVVDGGVLDFARARYTAPNVIRIIKA